MAQNNGTIDGFFLPRRNRAPQPGERPGLDTIQAQKRPTNEQNGLRLQRREAAPLNATTNDYFHAPGAQAKANLGDATPTLPRPLTGRHGHEDRGKKSFLGQFKKPSRQTLKRVSLIVLAILVIVGGYFLVKFFLAAGNIFQGNAFSAIFAAGKPLEMDSNGRTNILLFGTSEDDPGHEGATLTDSIMLVSIDQNKKDAFLVSIPRDLYVDYGMACNSGYEGKINEVYLCGKANGEDSEEAGQKALRNKVGEVFGLKMQYSVHVNYAAMRDVVDAVGGVTVEIKSDDPRGILDRNFDWKCNYECNYVKYPNGPVELNGERALALARARGASVPNYGLNGGNFDREQYQRKILVALKDKAASAGTLANPVAINGLIDALGNNVRTTFEAEEIKTLAQLGQDINGDAIRSLSLVDEKDPLVTTGDVNGMSIVQPVAGLFDYSDIATAVRAYASGDTAFLERATVDVLNMSGQAGVAQTKADKLSEAGIIVEVVGNAPEKLDNAPVRLYNLSGGEKPKTLQKLESLLGVQAIEGTPPGVTSASDFVVLVGGDGAS